MRMILNKVKEKHTRKDSWMRDLLKSYAPEYLASLIQKRIENPNKIGPYLAIMANPKEEPTDIIWALIETEEPVFRAKMEPAVGLLLYKMLRGELKETPELLSGVFNIIYESRLTGCQTLVYNWLQERLPILTKEKSSFQIPYRDGLMAFARIQGKSEQTELFWRNLWLQSKSTYHAAAFVGLRIQSPQTAAEELPLFARRKVENKGLILFGMWNEFTSRPILESAIKRGLKDDGNWAGQLLNTLLGTMSEENKEQLLLNMKER